MSASVDPAFGYSGSVDPYGIQKHVLNYSVSSLEDVVTAAAGQSVLGIPELTREISVDPCGTFNVAITYEGIAGITGQYQYALKTTYKEEPLESHPQILAIAKKYNGTLQNDGHYKFPPTLPAGTNSSSGSRGNQTATVKNPFFGVEKYMILMVTWQRMYAAYAIPPGILSNVGKIIGAPPGPAPTLPNRSQWLVMPPQATPRGNCFFITEEYLLLEENPPLEIYSTGALGGDANPNASGASSGVGGNSAFSLAGGAGGNQVGGNAAFTL